MLSLPSSIHANQQLNVAPLYIYFLKKNDMKIITYYKFYCV